MKITALTVVINEEDYVYYALASVVPIVDQFIIVEGVSRRRFAEDAVERGIVTQDGRSGDGTDEAIQQFILDYPNANVRYIHAGWVENVNALRQAALELVKPDTDWCLVVDADTMYDALEIRNILKIADPHPLVKMIAAKNLMFWLDMQHLLTVPENKLVHCKYVNSGFLWRYDPQLVMQGQRPYLNKRHYELDTIKVDPEYIDQYSGTQSVYLFHPDGVFKEFHFGWVHSPKKVEAHLLRIAHAFLDTVKKGKRGPRENTFLPLLGKSDEEILDWYRTYHKIWTRLYDPSVGEHEEEFKGVYPEVVEAHPFFGKTREELGWND